MSLQGKTTMSDDFELGGEDEMEPTSSVTFSTYVTSRTCVAEQASICVYKAYTFLFLFLFFKWPIVSLDKTLFIV